MLETNDEKNPWICTGIIAIAFIVGVILGMVIHHQFAATAIPPKQEMEPYDSDDALSNTTAITIETQQEAGIIVEPVARHVIHTVLYATGTISADPAQVSHLQLPVSGMIEKSYVDLGDHVEKDDLLIEYDGYEYVELDASDEDNPETTLDLLNAPLSGIVTALNVMPGDIVESSTDLLSITDVSTLLVTADVFEEDLPHVQSGQVVKVRVPMYPTRVFRGKIDHIGDIIDPETRTTQVRCVVNNASGLLALEVAATIEFPVERDTPVLAIPDAAIQRIDDRAFVFVQTSATEFQKREVRTGVSDGSYTEIISGIEDGDPVVVNGNLVVHATFFRHSRHDEHDFENRREIMEEDNE